MRFLCPEKSVVVTPPGRRIAARLVPALLLLSSSMLAAPPPAPEDAESDVALRGVVIPTGFQGEKYLAMIQVAVDGSPLPGATWDLGLSFLPDGGRRMKHSSHVRADEPGRPVVFETLIEFYPGHYLLELEAQETSAGQSQTRRQDGRWPDPTTSRATISPVILLQPVQGTFVRGENRRTQGALAVGEDDSLGTNLPTAVVSVVCRGAKTPGAVRVERELEGASSVEFETIELAPGNEPCAQVRDILPPGTLGAGYFRYSIRVIGDDGEIAMKNHEFTAGDVNQEERSGS